MTIRKRTEFPTMMTHSGGAWKVLIGRCWILLESVTEDVVEGMVDRATSAFNEKLASSASTRQ